MEREQLKQTLGQLQQQLRDEQSAPGSSLDAETRALLQQLSAEVNGLLQSASGPPRPEDATDLPVQRQTVLDSLLDLTEEFEESHPRLAETIGQMATALSRIGI